MATPAQLGQSNIPTIALVGRVNVGKSALFNKLIEEQKAIVSDVAGTTRTNNEGMVIWRGAHIKIIDTGGLTFVEGVPFEEDIIKQTEYAMDHADLILLVTDAQTGILPQELELAKRLRKRKDKRVLVVANKVDNHKFEPNIQTGEWERLGLGEPFPVSAGSGRNLGDLLDRVYEILEAQGNMPIDALIEDPNTPIRVSIIGKPNVGKSSLFNKLIGEDRVIVSDVAHTTREPYDTLMEYTYVPGEDDLDDEGQRGHGHTNEDETKTYRINFVDTAGIRRKARVEGSLERQGIFKSIDSIDKSDIILFVIDGSEQLSHQDMQLGGLLERHGKSVMLIVNKWDLADDNTDARRNEVKRMIYSYFPHLEFAPILFVSGLTGYRVHQIFPSLIKVWQGRNTHVANRALEQMLAQVTKEHFPSRGKGTRHPEIMGMRQINQAPPVFELFVKFRTSLHRSYLNFIENKMRERFNFYGTPIIIKITKMKR